MWPEAAVLAFGLAGFALAVNGFAAGGVVHVLAFPAFGFSNGVSNQLEEHDESTGSRETGC
ncbi:MAG: hypothetical protein LBU11_09335 [Zoogloeaceae bacterium]|nr:hypothetical protein [Zoogloeaceae bacterium]